MASPVKTYDRFDPAKPYERIIFRPDRVLQSAELNELQSMQQHRLRGISDVLFKEGDIIRGCQCSTDLKSGKTSVAAGALYIAGAMRGIEPGSLTVATAGTVYVGAYLTVETVSELEDPGLYNPAINTRGAGEPGALRERVRLVWGTQGDGKPGTFYPVWTITDGYVMPKEPPPNIDAVTKALERYDRDSAGGTYVVRGLDVVMGADQPDGRQVYTVREGAARIGGHPLELGASRRLVHGARPDLQFVDSEPHTSSTEGTQRVVFDRVPAVGEVQVRVQARKTVTLSHGAFTGAADPLPDNAVLLVETVQQGGKVFDQGADYVLKAGQIDWSPSGAEPLPGSSFEVTYQYMLSVKPSSVDERGCTIKGALPGTLILVSYYHALRRWDRLVMDGSGTLQWILGVPSPWAPKQPQVPSGTLSLASVYQSWDGQRRLEQDAVRMVSMQTLNAYRDQIQAIYADLAELRLAVDVSGRHSGVKKGLFADPMIDNLLRDAGRAQSAHILGGQLRLPMLVELHQIGTSLDTAQTTAYKAVPVVGQLGRTGRMLVNPYSAFDPLPKAATLTPAVDYWTEVKTQWANPILQQLTPSQAAQMGLDAGISENVLGESSTVIQYLRQIEIAFWIDFPAGEMLQTVTFDGISITPKPLAGGTLVAGTDGLRGTLRIPADVPAGTKPVMFMGRAGTQAEAIFTGQGTLLERQLQKVTVQLYDPLAQTFTLPDAREICGVRLWFEVAGKEDVQVQLRAVSGGIPTRSILAECVIKPGQIKPGGQPTQAQWPPVSLDAGTEYAIVVLTNDASCALAIAELGGWDAAHKQWITSQPYSVGVLLSSSNASTWTPHQMLDMAFELLAAEHTDTARTLELGMVTVKDATELMVQAGAVLPTAAAKAVFALQLKDGTNIEAAPGQPVQLASRYSGPVTVRARLAGDKLHAAQLLPGMQLVAGSVQTSGDYISPALGAGSGVALHVVAQTVMPAGSALAVQWQADGSTTWQDVPYLSASPQTAGVMELTYRASGITADRVRVRLILTGSHSARPQLTNLRAIVI